MPDSSQSQNIDQTSLRNSEVQQTQAGRDALSFQNSPNANLTINNVVRSLFPPRSQPQVDWQWATQILQKRQQPEIRGRLKDTLIQQQQLWVGLQEQPQQVGRNPLEAVQQLQVGDKDPETLEPGHLMIEVLGRNDIQGRLLILGVPGAGKTTMLLSLAEQLVMGALQNPKTVIPIMFELSAWKDDRQGLENWLIDQLYENFGGNRKTYKQWLDQRVLLPLLDGLDELGMERQQKCAAKINEFALHYPQVVVCCRVKEYEEAGVRLDGLQGAVCLQPLSDGQIQNYLTKIDRQELWQAVQASDEMRRLLEPDEDGEVGLLRVPLFVAMAAAVYEPSQQFSSKAELLEKYWERQLARDTRKSDRRRRELRDRRWAYKTVALEPDRRETRRYLGWLARSLRANNQTELLLEQMQPRWLETRTQKWQYRLIGWLIGGLIGGLITGLIGGLIGGLFYGLFYELIGGLIGGLFYGLIVGLYCRLIGWMNGEMDNIEPVEAFQISMSRFARHEMVRGLGQGLNFGLIGGMFLGMAGGLFYGLIGGLISWLIIGLFFGLIGGLKRELKVRSRPNQGILNSLQSMVFTAIFACPLGGFFIVSLIVTSTITRGEPIASAIKLLPTSLIFGALTSLVFVFENGGGRPFIQHFTLRFILTCHRLTPWRYVRFLNYCTERRLLQRVGGRYRFIHRELLEHLARGGHSSNVE